MKVCYESLTFMPGSEWLSRDSGRRQWKPFLFGKPERNQTAGEPAEGRKHSTDNHCAGGSAREESEQKEKIMDHILFWIIVGIAAGLLAKMVVPGEGPGGILG